MLNSYSHSALGTYRTCPRQFKYKYIEKTKVARKTEAHTLLGNIVHRALSRLYKYGSDGVLISLQDILAYYNQEWGEVDSKSIAVTDDYYAVDDYIRMGREMLEKHYERYQPFNQHKLLGAEQRFSFTLKDTPFRFSAIIDRLTKRSDGTIEICDYKTGKRLARADDPDFLHQMGLYQLAVMEAYPQFEKIELVQHFLRFDEEVRSSLDPGQLDELVEQLRVTVVESLNSERLDDFPTNKGPLCRFCDYEQVCPEFRHRYLLEQENDDAKDEIATAEDAKKLATKLIKIDAVEKQAKAEGLALKKELSRIVKELGISSVEGEGGSVSVKFTRTEKLVTKTVDKKAHADLQALARQLGFDDYFVLDANSFMKEIYRKGRLTPEQLEMFDKFIAERESSVVKVKQDKRSDDPEE